MKKFFNTNKKHLAQIVFLISFVFMFAMPVISLADNDPISMTINPPIKATTITGLIKTILEGVIKIGIPVIALALVYSGFLFVFALGKPEELKKAKDALLYTLIGAGILLGSWAIAQLISETVLQL